MRSGAVDNTRKRILRLRVRFVSLGNRRELIIVCHRLSPNTSCVISLPRESGTQNGRTFPCQNMKSKIKYDLLGEPHSVPHSPYCSVMTVGDDSLWNIEIQSSLLLVL